ncbi:MAG: isoprenylcysteine carboxylmethyltransferase family protein [Cytophagaceae bacterium]|nr:isoprenylcysteine carboxylmethyltransferase family protein [Gemmatimonadaceae bacterium]
MAANLLLLRAVLAFLALPGVVAVAIPWMMGRGAVFRSVGFAVLVPGLVLLLWCVRDFYVAGRGTLAPWSPPVNLVRVGLYRFSRNPMYVGVLTMLMGWSLGFNARGHWLYAAAIAIAFHLRVVFYEEPWLARTHGDAWRQYAARVPRWLF